MSSTHGLGDEPFMQFDPYERSSSPLPPLSMLSSDMDSLALDNDSMLLRDGEVGGTSSHSNDKGKMPSKPLPIMISARQASDFDDTVMSPAWSTSSSYPDTPTALPSPGSLESSFPSFTLGSFSAVWPSSGSSMNPDAFEASQPDSYLQDKKGKGKERDDGPPSIPPLSLSPVSDPFSFPEFTSPGASSSSANRRPTEHLSTSPDLAVEHSLPLSSAINRFPSSRRHTFSHSLIRPRHPSSLTRLKAKLSSPTRSRKVLSKKLITSPSQPATPQLTSTNNVHIYTPPSLFEVTIPFENEGLDTCLPVHSILKGKGRSYSSPLPISVLDYIPADSEDMFVPITPPSINFFDGLLPKELKLKVLLSLAVIHENDQRKITEHDDWSVTKSISSKNRWLGRDKASRELVKLSRVSKTWRDLVYDGQLWSNFDLRSFPNAPRTLLSSIARNGGRFATSIDLSGHVHISPATLQDITDNMCLLPLPPAYPVLAATQLTSLNFQGCSALSTRSLHYLLVRSPGLQQVCFRGLHCVTNTTCDIIAMYCPRIVKLDLNRCLNMDAEGLKRLASAVKARGEVLRLTELRLSGIKNIDDSAMTLLGQVAPFLEVLDLSYARHLHNSALDAFVALNADDYNGVQDSILLTSREAGRDPSDSRRYRRRVTRLRHLSLSSCILLMDIACSHLAHAVPRLQFLELGGIGEDMGEEGLIRLLNTTPMIRRLDLEDATEITDAVLTAITPELPPDPNPSSSKEPIQLQPGHALEHLIVSYAAGLTDEAFLALIRSCTRLKVLEADNTRMGSSVLRQFCELRRPGSKIVAVDCRSIPEKVVKELAPLIRPRRGWRGWDARKLRFLDGRDFGVGSSGGERDKEKEAVMKAALGQDELDEQRVVVKTFYSSQIVDAVWTARDKRRKAISRRKASESSETDMEELDPAGGSGRVGGTRWWTPGGRRSRSASGSNSPLMIPDPTADTCVVM
ncbi:hypothetical protein F5878DRAFT_654868 [Lentinula raphanica]|uniref:F-box domain-containing protein n=1 Tax=Lentinula raphanica TaxID=153919 RepID=A0AA38UL91_9AGAR|nr:hypothetical protein F5878DRAFT_654868 [Lentinula raphanica]